MLEIFICGIIILGALLYFGPEIIALPFAIFEKSNSELKEFRKKFKNYDISYRRLSDLKDLHYSKNHEKPNFVNYKMTEFAVKYIDPKTMYYNDQYRLEWNK